MLDLPQIIIIEICVICEQISFGHPLKLKDIEYKK